MSAGSFQDWMTALGQNESGNNYAFVSSAGYLGRFQFGEEALKAVGFYNGDDTAALDFTGSWTAEAASFGVFDKAGFLASAAAQDAAGAAWVAKIVSDLDSLDLGRFDGQTIGGVQITTSGLIAGAHLVGVWALKDFLESGGADNTLDYYGTPVSAYVAKFGGYDTPYTLEDSTPTVSMTGGSGSDTLTSGSSGGYLRGEDGNDSLQGGAGFDDINGNKGDDTIDGGSGGSDWLVGGQGNDLITAHAGRNILDGNLGDDTLHAGSEGDVLRGGQGDDVIVGGAGNDYISGDRGNDTESGAGGADIFHSFAGGGIDKVLDFNAGEGDRVMLDLGTTYVVHQSGVDTVIDLTGGGEVVLSNVPMSSLPSGWIFEG